MKKQSQFLKGISNASIVLSINYGINSDWEQRKNKPKRCHSYLALGLYWRLKKQSQFCGGKNELKCLYDKNIWEFYDIFGWRKTKPNKPNEGNHVFGSLSRVHL